VKYEKKFLIIGNQNAISGKEIFGLIKGNKIWLGMVFQTATPSLPDHKVTRVSLRSGVYDPRDRIGEVP
jgi:hypothetical protein